MFERLGGPARRVVELAQHEARRLDHNYVGTEHLLLGLLAEGDGVAAHALDALGVTADAIRARVEEMIGRGECRPSGTVPFTPRSKKVLQLAGKEAAAMGDDEVGTEHLLLALVDEGEGVAARILADLGADDQRVRLQVSAVMGRPCAPSRHRRRRAFGRSR